MLLQFSIVGFEWIIGLGLMFGLAFVFNYLTFNKLASFFVYLTIFNCFVVWADLLDLWTLGLNIAVLIVIIYFQMKSQTRSEQ
jgi:hypothetical protein